MTAPTPVDAQLRRLFAGFDVPVEPPPDLATRLRLRVLAGAELDGPMAQRPVPPPNAAPMGVAPNVHARLLPATPTSVSEPYSPTAPSSLLPPPSSRPDEVGVRRRRGQPR